MGDKDGLKIMTINVDWSRQMQGHQALEGSGNLWQPPLPGEGARGSLRKEEVVKESI